MGPGPARPARPPYRLQKIDFKVTKSIFHQKSTFSLRIFDLSSKIDFEWKNRCFCENIDFSAKNRFFIKKWIFHQKIDFSSRNRCFNQIVDQKSNVFIKNRVSITNRSLD